MQSLARGTRAPAHRPGDRGGDLAWNGLSPPPGSTLAWNLRKGETMTGVCERHMGAMRFALRSDDRDD